mgnify:FL=1
METKTYNIEGRSEIGEGYLPSDFPLKAEMTIRRDGVFCAVNLKLEFPPAHLKWLNEHKGIEVDLSSTVEFAVGRTFRIKGFGKANNAWEGGIRNNFGEWRFVSEVG